MASTSFVNPSSLSFSSQTFVPASPAPSSSYTHEDDEHDDMDSTHSAGPARKRARTSGSSTGKDSTGTLSVSEQRKEARAHRNRIAAQNSRDRRKAQFSFLERRVTELEEENRRLRAGMAVIPIPAAAPISAQPVFAANLPPTLSSAVEDHLRAEREKARERENEELKERIKTLERGWDAVVKALAAQGVAAGLIGATQTPTTATISTPTTTQAPSPKLEAPTKPSFTAFPSPAPSHSSLDSESSSPIPDFFPLAQTSTGGDHRGTFIGSLDVPAAGGIGCGASANGESLSAAATLYQGAAVEGATALDEDNDKAMEALFREILASPRAAHAAVPTKGAAGGTQVTASVEGEVGGGAEQQLEEEEGKGAKVEEDASVGENAVAEWANEIEMQRMLDSMLMDIQGGNSEMGIMEMGSGLGMDLNMNIDLGLDLDLGLAYDAGVDFSRAAWDVSGAGVF